MTKRQNNRAVQNSLFCTIPKLLLCCLFVLSAVLLSCKPRQYYNTDYRSEHYPGLRSRYQLRILLLNNAASFTFRAAGGFTAQYNFGGQSQTVRFNNSSPVKISLTAGQINILGKKFSASPVLLSSGEPYVFTLNGNDYRGRLRLIVNADKRTFDVINLVQLEPYLQGVVGAEMPYYWQPEALKAQAIVARTYCLYIKKKFGVNRQWDLAATQANQVYVGIKGEKPKICSAVQSTAAMVLVYTASDGSDILFPTYYSSVCGGHTENSKNVFGDSMPPLTGVECPYCRDVARINDFLWPMQQFSKKTVSDKLIRKYPKLKRLGKIVDIIPTSKSVYKNFTRINRVKLVGSTGKTDTIRGEDLRLTVDPTGRKIKSTAFNLLGTKNKWLFLSGRGWGHGVGMCQCGAEGMARKGKTSVEILKHYYPGSRIVKIY